MCFDSTVTPQVMSYADFQQLSQPEPPAAFSYGSDPLQHVELWKPEAAGPFPVILLIHGGCWQTSVAKAGIMGRLAAAFVDKGVAVWNVEYRGIDVPGGGYPGTFQDVAAAADLLRDCGFAMGLDPTRVVAVGHSAGGHLAAWLAGRHAIPAGSVLWMDRPLALSGVVSLGGLLDLAEVRHAAAEACGADTVDRLVGPATMAHPDPYNDTSPVSLAPLGVAQVLVSGDVDTIAPPCFADHYAAKMQEQGDRVQKLTIADQGHFELITPGRPAADAAIAEALRLLAIQEQDAQG